MVPKYCISDSLVDYDGYSISSKGFLPTIVDIMVIWVKFTHSSHFSALIPRMSAYTLAISCLTPWFMDLTFQVPMQYCSLQHRTLLSPPVPSTTGRHSCFGSASSFLLELFLCSSPVAYRARTDLRNSSFTFSYYSWGSQGQNAEVVCHSLLHWTTFCQSSPPWPVCLGRPYMAWLIV